MSRLPLATIALAVVLAVVFAWQLQLDAYHDMQAVLALGVVPAHLFGLRNPPPSLDLLPPVVTLVTAQGLHGGIGHLLGNLAAHAFVAPTAESRIGPLRLLAVFLVAGAVGLAVEAAAAPTSTIPILGASASVAGIIGAVARRAPHARLRLVVPTRRFRLRRVELPVLPLIAFWLVAQVAGIAFEEGEPVAFLAHATGFVVGALLAGSGRHGSDAGDLRHRA